MQRIAMGEWLPDQPGLIGGITVASNCYPTSTGYAPFPQEADFSAAAAENLTSLVYVKNQSGTAKLYAAGLTKIYSVDSVGALTQAWYQTGTYSQSASTTLTVTATAHGFKTGDSVYLNFTSGTATDGQFTVTKVNADSFTVTTTSATTSGNVQVSHTVNGYSTPANNIFRFTKFGSLVIGTNFSQRLQYLNADGGTSFKNLSDDAPVAKFITVVRDFVVVAHLQEGATTKPFKVQWSGINAESSWTASQTTQSDSQELVDGGHIKGIRGGEYGLILMEKGIYRMTYVGTPFVFQFDNISRGKGCVAEGSICQYDALTFFLSDDGFYVCDGQQVVPIGAEKVDRFFFEDADLDLSTMSSAADPIRKLVIWNYKNKFAVRKMMVYNVVTKKWSHLDATSDYISDASTASVTLEQLDSVSASLDALPTPMDSPLYAGGKFFLGGTDGTKVITFNGLPKSAVLETGDISTGGMAMVNLAKPQVDNGSATVALASRLLLNENVTYGDDVAADSDNRVSMRGAGRYHRLRVKPTGDNWKMAVAVDVEVIPMGSR